MQSLSLGNCGLSVSKLGFGAWPIGGITYGNISRTNGLSALHAYLEMGGRFIDTARGYRTSESMVGEVMRTTGLRHEIVLASKTKANTAADMRMDLDTSLRELGTEYLDIYYLHQPPASPAERDEALAAMAAFKQEGKIRHIGASISGPNVTAQTEQMCRDYIATGQVAVIQVIFSIFRQRLRSILELAQSHGVGVVGRTALESGFLTGKYTSATQFPEGDHRNRWTEEQRRTIFESVDAVRRAMQSAAVPNLDMISAAIGFASGEPGIDTVILGAKSADQARRTFCYEQIPPLPDSLRQELIKAFSGRDALYNI